MTTALAAVALVLGVARLAMFIALHLIPSDYNIVQHAVSDYAVGPTRRLAAAVTWTSAVFWAVLAGAVTLGPPTPEKGVALWLAVLAVIFAALPFLPTDVEGSRTLSSVAFTWWPPSRGSRSPIRAWATSSGC